MTLLTHIEPVLAYQVRVGHAIARAAEEFLQALAYAEAHDGYLLFNGRALHVRRHDDAGIATTVEDIVADYRGRTGHR